MNHLKLDNIQDRHLGRIIQLQAETNGDTDFLIDDSQRISFAQAEDLTNRLATGFQSLGLAKGDRVAFVMANVPEMILMCIALNKIGAIWVPICTDYKGKWLLDTVKRSRAKILVFDEEHRDKIEDIQSDLEHQHYVTLEHYSGGLTPCSSYSELKSHPPLQVDYSTMSYSDTCAILWTSGTTGRSKGVMQGHNVWIRSTELGSGLMYHSVPGDIIYCALPLYNAGSWITCVARAMITGISCVIEKKFSVSQFLPRIKHFGATQTFAVGSMGVFLMNTPEAEDDADNPLKQAAIAPMPPHLWEAFEKRFGLSLLRSGMGQSECLLTLNQEHSDVELPPYSLGFPPPDADVQLFDDDGIEVPDGEPGEICIKPRAPHILFNGYFDAPEATTDSYRGDWFLTGDLARKDPETGACYFVDRKKDAVRFAGRNISTMEVESVVRQHPAVQDVAAFGIPNAVLESEDELKLNIVVQPEVSVSAEELCEFINDNAPHYFVPAFIEFVDALPLTPTNKVEKYKLRQAGLNDNTWYLKDSDYRVKK